MKRLVLLFALAFVGCATAPSQQTAIDAATASYVALDQAILAADASLKSGALKGQDARNALDGFTKAKAGLDTALAVLKAATPASGAK